MTNTPRSTLDGFVLVHRTLSTMGWQLAAALRRPTAPETAAGLSVLWDFYAAGLRDHHEGESEVIFPLVAARDHGFAALEAAMRHQHDDIDGLLDEAGRAVDAVVADATQTSSGAAAAVVEALTNALDDHLREEELLVLPAVVAAIPDSEMAAIERRFVRHLGMGRMAPPVRPRARCRRHHRGSPSAVTGIAPTPTAQSLPDEVASLIERSFVAQVATPDPPSMSTRRRRP